ncbi:MAG: hypothetical protein ACTSP9_14310 [Promethearchaeota archaeon]
MNEIQFRWIVNENSISEFVSIFENKGIQVVDDKEPFTPRDDVDVKLLRHFGDSAFEPLVIITIALSIGALITVISERILEHKYPGGEVIDIRNGKLKRISVPTLEHGSLYIITEEGTKEFYPKNRKKGLKFLQKSLEAMIIGKK